MTPSDNVLADTLHEAGWGARDLARAVNEWLSTRGQGHLRLDPTAPYAWLRKGYCPRQPIPTVVAAVLSQQLGRPISAADLWPGRAEDRGVQAATDDLREVRTVAGSLQALADLGAAGAPETQGLLAASGADLMAAVADGLHVVEDKRGPRRPCGLGRVPGGRVTSAQVEVIAAHVGALRRLDDQHGGGALNLAYTAGELRAVLDLRASIDPATPLGRRLTGVVVDLAQLLGWVWFDAGRDGEAERYLLLAARLARSVGERGRMVNAVGMLAYVSAFAGHGTEAVRIAGAAFEAVPARSPLLRARILGRQATSAAANGDLPSFRSSAAEARGLLAAAVPGHLPDYLYYLEPAQLIAENGQALVTIGARRDDQAPALLSEAVDQLTPISGIGERPDYPRSALLHASFLAEAHLRLGNLPEAVAAARAAIARLETVQSGRGRAYLAGLRPAFARRNRSPLVADLLPELDAALSLV